MNKPDDSAYSEKDSGRHSLPHIPWVSEKLFYGWVVVFIGAVTQFFQGVSSQGYAAYMTTLETQFGWSKAILGGPRSVTTIESSIMGPIEGYLVDRFGPRRVVAAGVFIMGSGLILFGLTQNLWMYYMANIIIALGTGLQGLLVMSVAVNNWFRRKRSLSQSVMSLGFPMAGVVGVPAVVLIIQNFGWEVSAISTGLLIWVVGFPCTMLLRTKPEHHGLLPDGDVSADIVAPDIAEKKAESHHGDEYDFTLRQALRTRAFWFLALGWGISNLGIVSIQIYLFMHLEQGLGMTPIVASLVWTVASTSNIPSRLIGGFFGDRLPKNIVIGFSVVLMGVAIIILGLAQSLPMAMVYAVLFGLGWGVRTPVMNAIQGEYFGRESQGIIRGWLQVVSIPFTIAAPVVTGHMADVQGTFKYIFIILAVITIGGAVLIFMATRPKRPEH